MQKKISFKIFCLITFSLFFIFNTIGCGQLVTRRDSKYEASDKNDKSDRGARREKPRDDFSSSGDLDDREETPAPPPDIGVERKVAVILGPGGYKMFAHAGVLKELRKKNIPVDKIVGIEWGSLVAALYALHGQISEVEWKLYKLEKLDLNTTGFFANKSEPKNVEVLETFLKTNLDKKEVAQAAVPFTCPALNIKQGTVSWIDYGPMVKAVEYCLPAPPLYKPRTQLASSLLSTGEIAGRLRREGYNVVILVDILGTGEIFESSKSREGFATSMLWTEARRELWKTKSHVTDIIEVPTNGIALSDFGSRKLLVTAGEAAGEKAAGAIVSKYGF